MRFIFFAVVFSSNDIFVKFVATGGELTIGSKLWLASERLRAHGAGISKSLSCRVTHVIIDDDECELRIDGLKVFYSCIVNGCLGFP